MEEIRYGPPPKLYDLCMKVVVTHSTSDYRLCKQDFRLLSNTALVDFYETLFNDRRLCILSGEFSQLNIFRRLLYVKSKRIFLIRCYQELLNHGTDLNRCLLTAYKKYADDLEYGLPDKVMIKTGIMMGSFLNECGWFEYSAQFLNIVESMINPSSLALSEIEWKLLLECYNALLYAYANNCNFPKATNTFHSVKKIIRKLKKLNAVPNLSTIYTTFSMFFFVTSRYNESYTWSVKALALISSDLTNRDLVDVLRQASKACVVKRKFAQAAFLIRQAVNMGEILNLHGQHLLYANILMDYGFYLLNSDSIAASVVAYEKGLTIRQSIFEKDNIYIAIGYEDLAYALYVNEYSSGNFWKAMDHAESSIKIMEKILPKNHILLASVNRIKALILEEMALDERSDIVKQKSLLDTAEDLHIDALRLSRQYFGDDNVQTAKHFGNLGRLYQSMKQFDEAERMHRKAIAIKEKLLGKKDYEVGLSVGHLASLYNYHMKRYNEAEKLYLRSIEINLSLFGPAYSGLEYDYRGLMNIYNKIVDPASALYYHTRYREWKALRDKLPPTSQTEPLLPTKEIIRIFFNIGSHEKVLQIKRADLAKELLRGYSVNNEENTNGTDDLTDSVILCDGISSINSSDSDDMSFEVEEAEDMLDKCITLSSED